MEELLNLIKEQLKDESYFVIGQLSNIIEQMDQQLQMAEEYQRQFVRFQQKVFSVMPEMFQQIVNEIKAEDLAEEQKDEC